MLGEDENADKAGFALSESHRQIAVWGVLFLGLFVLALGAGLYFFRSNSSLEDIKIISTASPSGESQTKQIVIDIGGAVNLPGLYKLSGDARVADAISAAGGLTNDADSKQVNLAAKVGDGQKVYIQKVGELGNQNSGTLTNQVAGATTNGLININSATAAELDTLPGVGPVTADKIITSRPYGSLNELLLKKAVSSSVFEKIKDKLSY